MREHPTPFFASFTPTDWKSDLLKVFTLPCASACFLTHPGFVSYNSPFSRGRKHSVQILQDQTTDLRGLPVSLESRKCHPETHHRCCCPPDTDLRSIRYLFRGLGREAVWYLAMIYKAWSQNSVWDNLFKCLDVGFEGIPVKFCL